MLSRTLWFSLVHSCISWSWKMIFPKSSLKGNSHRYAEYFFTCWLWNPFNVLSLNKGQHFLPVALVNHYGTNNATTVYASMNSAALFICACICICLSIYNLISSNILRTCHYHLGGVIHHFHLDWWNSFKTGLHRYTFKTINKNFQIVLGYIAISVWTYHMSSLQSKLNTRLFWTLAQSRKFLLDFPLASIVFTTARPKRI